MIAARWVRNSPKGVAAQTAKPEGDDEHDRKGGTEQQGQTPVHPVENGENTQEADAIVKERDDDRGEHFIHVLDVVGEARDQSSHRMRVEESEIQAQHVSEEVLTNGVHDVLSGPFEGNDLEEIGDETDYDHPQKQQPELRQPRQAFFQPKVRADDITIHSHLDQTRQCQAGRGYNEGQQNRNRHPSPLGEDEPEQTPPEPDVTHLTDMIVFKITVIMLHEEPL